MVSSSLELIAPNVFRETLALTLSEDEYYSIAAALDCSDNIYWVGDEKFTIQTGELEEKDYE